MNRFSPTHRFWKAARRGFFAARFVAGVVTMLACSKGALAQSLDIRTLAGNGMAGATNGFGSHARFDYPTAVAVDNDGNAYVVDTGNSIVRKITFDGFTSTLAGIAGSNGSADGNNLTALFYGPQGIAIGSPGQIFVADSANSTIRKISAEGTVSTIAGLAGVTNSFDGQSSAAQFFHPEALAADSGGNLYIADTWNHTIRKLTPDGTVTTIAGLAGHSGSLDGAGNKARFNRPSAVVVDSATNVLVADCLNHTIRKISPEGIVTTVSGLAGVWGRADGTNTDARFNLPDGLGLAANGDIIVSDSGNHSLRRLSLEGTNWVASTVAGMSGLTGYANGAGNNARFNFPGGIAFDSSGYLYIADAGNHSLRTTRVVPPTLQFTVAGAYRLVLSWPASAEGFVLEQSSALGPAAAWSALTNDIVWVADNFVRTNSLAGGAYYRLHRP